MTEKELEKIIKLRKNFMTTTEILRVMPHLSSSTINRLTQFMGYHGEHELRRCGGIVDRDQPLDDDRYASIAEYAVAHNWGAEKAAIIFKVERHRLSNFVDRRKKAGCPISDHIAELPPNVALNREYDPCKRGFSKDKVRALAPKRLPEPEVEIKKGGKASPPKVKKPPRAPLGPADGKTIKNKPNLGKLDFPEEDTY